MKLKIVMKVPMHSDKAKSKAMQIAVAIPGVDSVSIGKDNDEIQVIGEGVDAVCLAKSLRKKFCFGNIVSVEEVKPAEVKPAEVKTPDPPVCHYPPPWNYECLVYETGPAPNCSIC